MGKYFTSKQIKRQKQKYLNFDLMQRTNKNNNILNGHMIRCIKPWIYSIKFLNLSMMRLQKSRST